MNIQCAECKELNNEKYFNTIELFIFKPEFKICYTCKYGTMKIEG